MNNYHFKIAVEEYEDDAYVMADDYESAMQKLFNNYEFSNYMFIGLDNN